jgi:hypothetical protein
MPLINQNIQKILREAGLAQDSQEESKVKTSNKEQTDLEIKLEAAGLSLDDVLADLSYIARQGGSEAIRLRALENALKAHGVNKDQPPAVPTINIIINDSKVTSSQNDFDGINPILIPRKMHKSKIENEEEKETVQ